MMRKYVNTFKTQNPQTYKNTSTKEITNDYIYIIIIVNVFITYDMDELYF